MLHLKEVQAMNAQLIKRIQKLEKEGYTAQQIGNMTGILSGMPIAATGTNTYQGTSTQPVREPGTMQQLAGAGLTGLSLYKAYGG